MNYINCCVFAGGLRNKQMLIDRDRERKGVRIEDTKRNSLQMFCLERRKEDCGEITFPTLGIYSLNLAVMIL